ncbi:MAG: YkgJ family cysteine cluster protein [Chitinophagaceae bacterium]
MHQTYIHDLSILEQMADKNEEENDRFRLFLKQQDSRQVDKMVQRLNTEVSAAIDCTQCGNCCRSLMINILPQEAQDLAAHLKMATPEFKESYVEESEQGQLIMKSIPCHFLDTNKCSIYDHRFHECREFPHLHKPGFVSRLFGTLMHYGRCPIIFNVIESLKSELSFSRKQEFFSPV